MNEPMGFSNPLLPSRSQISSPSDSDRLTPVVFWGACACLALTPLWFDWGARFTVRNTILSLLQILQYGLVPALVLWRLTIQTPRPQAVTLRVAGAIGLLLGTIIVTWIATGGSAIGWLDWLELLVRFAVAGALLWYDGKSLRSPTPLVVLGLFGLVMVVGFVDRVWDISTLTLADWQAYPFLNVRTSFAAFEKLLLTGVVFGFAVKMARTASLQGPPMNPGVGATDADEHSVQPSRTGNFLASLSATTGAASKLIAAQTERTTLTTLRLPAAYRAVGKDCVQQKRHLHCVPELIEQLRSVMADLKSISETAKSQPVAQSLTDKAKAAGKQAAELVRQKQLGMKRDSLLAEIGRAIHDIHGDGSGPAEVVGPVREALERLSTLEADISRLAEVGKGSLLTPKRLAVGGGVAAALLLSVVLYVAGSWTFGGKNPGPLGSTGQGFAQNVLNLDEKSYVGGLRKSGSRTGTMSINNGGAGKGPLARNGGTYSLEKAEHSAGTMADAFQALLMLRPAQCVYYDSNQNGKCYGMGALDLSPALYMRVFGELDELVDANRSGRKAMWQLKCSDGTLHFVGEVIPNRLVRIEDVIPN